jgi:hypothetical protein
MTSQHTGARPARREKTEMKASDGPSRVAARFAEGASATLQKIAVRLPLKLKNNN